MCAIGIARPRRPPRVGHGTGDLQRLLDLAVVAPHLAPIERPIGAVAQQAARLEPLRAEAQRHHREVHRAAPTDLPLLLCRAARDCRHRRYARRSRYSLLCSVSSEAKSSSGRQYAPGVERHHREAVLPRACRPAFRRRPRCRRWRNRPAHRFAVLAHRHPGPPERTTGRGHARPRLPRGITEGKSSNIAVLAPGYAPSIPRLRLRRFPWVAPVEAQADIAARTGRDRPSRSRSTTSDARNRRDAVVEHDARLKNSQHGMLPQAASLSSPCCALVSRASISCGDNRWNGTPCALSASASNAWRPRSQASRRCGILALR